MKGLARNHCPSPAGSAGRTGSLRSIPSRAGAEPGSDAVRLDWAGREESIWLAGTPPRARLRKVPELSTGEGRSGNAILHADNLPAMAALAPTLRGRVDLAFLDPPYNAARERWIYPDRILGWFGSVVGAEGEDPLRHDKWSRDPTAEGHMSLEETTAACPDPTFPDAYRGQHCQKTGHAGIRALLGGSTTASTIMGSATGANWRKLRAEGSRGRDQFIGT
jgi:hypothetical protein